MELSHTNIKNFCIEPGLIETGLHRDWHIKPQELLGIETVLQPEDIAEAVLDILHKPDHVRIPKYMILPKGLKFESCFILNNKQWANGIKLWVGFQVVEETAQNYIMIYMRKGE